MMNKTLMVDEVNQIVNTEREVAGAIRNIPKPGTVNVVSCDINENAWTDATRTVFEAAVSVAAQYDARVNVRIHDDGRNGVNIVLTNPDCAEHVVTIPRTWFDNTTDDFNPYDIWVGGPRHGEYLLMIAAALLDLKEAYEAAEAEAADVLARLNSCAEQPTCVVNELPDAMKSASMAQVFGAITDYAFRVDAGAHVSIHYDGFKYVRVEIQYNGREANVESIMFPSEWFSDDWHDEFSMLDVRMCGGHQHDIRELISNLPITQPITDVQMAYDLVRVFTDSARDLHDVNPDEAAVYDVLALEWRMYVRRMEMTRIAPARCTPPESLTELTGATRAIAERICAYASRMDPSSNVTVSADMAETVFVVQYPERDPEVATCIRVSAEWNHKPISAVNFLEWCVDGAYEDAWFGYLLVSTDAMRQ